MVKSITIKKPKIIAILGTTASGKTRVAVDLARKFNGEIVSADSRQVYKGMDIGTGKDLDEYIIKKTNGKRQTAKKIQYHLIDIADPKTEFNLAKYQKLANQAIENIFKKGKLPIIAGGTGLYAQALVENFCLSANKPDKKIRNELAKQNIYELFKMLNKINPEFAKRINESDKKNKRRLIRYIEIAGDKVEKLHANRNKYNALIIGITYPKEILATNIKKRLKNRLEKEGMINEVKRLHAQGISWRRLESFGLEYKFVSQYLQKKLGYEEMEEKLFIAIRQFAKKQITWLKRWEKQGGKIYWENNKNKIGKLAKDFLTK